MKLELILVNFRPNDKGYAYYAPKGLLKAGDAVLVIVSKEYKAAFVSAERPRKHHCERAWQCTVQKIDTTSYEANMKSIEEAKEIKSQLEVCKAKFEEEAMYRMMAESNPDVAKLMTRLDKLGI